MTRPLLLGHRGARASRHIPENTLASYELCLQHGCDGFEFDVRLSADEQAVICHDATVNKMKIERSTSLGLGLPTLEEVLRQYVHRAFLDIELKVAGLEQQTLLDLRNHPPQRGYVISSFLPEVIAVIHKLDPTVPLGYLCEKRSRLAGWRESPAEWIIPRHDLSSREVIEKIRESGKRSMVWTVNDAEEVRKFVEWGVDAIISDETELLVSSLL
jgi:glycerophosphoryl diester phosphodiesterase